MPRRPVEVISGPRGPEHFPQREVEREPFVPAATPNRPAKPEGERTFVSRYMDHRIQVRADKNTIIDGHVVPGTIKAAVFRNRVFKTSDLEVIRALEANPNYGVDFWDQSTLDAQAEAAHVAQIKREILEKPELASALRAVIESGEFPLPGA